MPKFANARIKTDVRFHINTRMCVFNTQVDVRFYIYIYIYTIGSTRTNLDRRDNEYPIIYIYIYRPPPKLNLKTCFICIVIFLCPIGSRPAIPKPNHMILSPHNACIKGQTGPGRGPLWGAKVKREYFVFRKQQTNQKKTNRPTVHAGTVSSTRLSRAGYYLSLLHAGDLPIGACAPP